MLIVLIGRKDINTIEFSRAHADKNKVMNSIGGLLNTSTLRPLLEGESRDTGQLLRQLKPAQILQAIVLNRSESGTARLQIGNTVVRALTPEALQNGQQLLLRVEKGLPEPLLRIVQTPSRADPAQILQQQAMARQLPPKEIAQQLQTIKTLAQQLPVETLQRLPVLSQALKLLNPPATPLSRLTSTALQQKFESSGLFMESLMAHKGNVTNGDQKLLLLRLLNQLRPENRIASPGNTPGEGQEGRQLANADQMLNRLMRLVEGAITRIQSHQTLSLNANEQTGQLLWQVDVPVLVDGRREHLGLKIQREGENEDENPSGATWKIDVEFDFGELGNVTSRISINGKRVHCAFWSDKAATTSRFEQALPRLEKMLKDAGLEVSAVSALQGAPHDRARPSKQLLDERA